MQFNFYIAILLISAVLSGGLCLFAFRRRSVNAGTEFGLLMLATSLWSLFQAVEAMSTGLNAKIGWSAASYLGSQTIPVFLFLFSLRYTQRDSWMTRGRVLLFWIIPAVSVVLAATSGVQHFLWSRVSLTDTWAGVTAVYAHGPWYWVEVVYGYALILIAVTTLVGSAIKTRRVYSSQAWLIIVAVLIPLAANVFYALSPTSVKWLDITPITFTLTGFLLGAAVFRFHFLDIRPIAKTVLFEGIGDAMVAIDMEDRVVDLNPAAERLIGNPGDSLMGVPVSEALGSVPWLTGHPADGGNVANGDMLVEYGDSGVYYSVRIWPLLHGKRLIGRLITLRDVTEIRHAQADLEHLNSELRDINRELEAFSYSVSHDLQTPLRQIISYSDILTLEYAEALDEEGREVLRVINEKAAYLRRMIESILQYSRVSRQDMKVQDVDMTAAARAVIEELEQGNPDRSIEFRLGELPHAKGDPILLRQVLANLLSNAVKFTGGKEHAVIEIAAESGGDEVVYSVKDNGAGFDSERAGRLFSVFGRLHSDNEFEGTGIGLANVQRIVHRHGGRIRAEAKVGEGAAFYFTLPFSPDG